MRANILADIQTLFPLLKVPSSLLVLVSHLLTSTIPLIYASHNHMHIRIEEGGGAQYSFFRTKID